MESFKSVTSCINVGSLGDMTLIDTPGLNDPDARRSDKNIFIEMIKNLRIQLYDQEQGISSLILCIMPNASQRITDSTVKGMNAMFFMFNSLDDRIDIKSHPKYHVIINNVSRYGDDYDLETLEKDPNNVEINTAANLSIEKRIADIKAQLKATAKAFYLTEDISDSIKIGTKLWKDVKTHVCTGDEYKASTWYTELQEHQTTLV